MASQDEVGQELQEKLQRAEEKLRKSENKVLKLRDALVYSSIFMDLASWTEICLTIFCLSAFTGCCIGFSACPCCSSSDDTKSFVLYSDSLRSAQSILVSL